MKTKSLLSAIMLCLASLVSAQHTIHVPGDQPTIQAGIDAATNGDIVLVDQGTYYENINFKGKAITVKSHYDPLNPDSAHILNTIIDGSQPVDPDSASVVYFINDEDTLSVLLGFTIQGGKGTKDMAYRAGGGILGFLVGPKIEHNRIINNECTDDGGWATGGGINIVNSLGSISVIRNNEISNNACYKKSSGNGVPYGGGISIEYLGDGYECLIENNIISNNKCSNEVDDQYAIGGGIYVDYLKATIVNNQIIGNQIISTDDYWVIWGAGICAYAIKDGSNISGNLIADNSAISPWSTGGGLGIVENSGKVYVDRNIFSNDTAQRGGGVVLLELMNEVVFTNNVLKGNYATYQGGGIYIWDNTTKSLGYPKAARGINKVKISGEKNKDAGIAVIANNTFIENGDLYEDATSIHLRDESVPLIAFNNIFYDLEGGSGNEVYISEPGATAYLFNNLLDTVNSLNCNGDWQGADNIVGDPEFEDDFHLGEFSECVDRGALSLEIDATYTCPEFDFEGDQRPQSDQADIGADESPWDNPNVGIIEEQIGSLITDLSVYPNPVISMAEIRYQIFEIRNVNLSVYDAYGRMIEILVDKTQMPGEHAHTWSAEGLPAGMYYFRIQAGSYIGSGKIIKMD